MFPAVKNRILGMMSMNCRDLAERIEKMQPGAKARDVARLCLLLANCIDDVDALCNEDVLEQTWQDIGLRLQAATDQHAAMTEELEALSRSDPSAFNIEQVWVLIRAVKVQGQVLQMYLGRPVLDV
jgi:hypothetical protein